LIFARLCPLFERTVLERERDREGEELARYSISQDETLLVSLKRLNIDRVHRMPAVRRIEGTDNRRDRYRAIVRATVNELSALFVLA